MIIKRLTFNQIAATATATTTGIVSQLPSNRTIERWKPANFQRYTFAEN